MTVCPRRTSELTLMRHQGNTSLFPGFHLLSSPKHDYTSNTWETLIFFPREFYGFLAKQRKEDKTVSLSLLCSFLLFNLLKGMCASVFPITTLAWLGDHA